MTTLLSLRLSLSTDFGNANSSTQAPAEGLRRAHAHSLLIITTVLAFPLQAASASPPLPPPPPTAAPPHPAPNALPPAEQTTRAPTIDQACLDRLGAAGIEFEQVTLLPAVNPACAIATPVRLKAVKLPPRWRTSIRLPEEPTLSCQFGERFGDWLRDLVAPLIAGELAAELKSVHTGPGYECRNRNHAETGKISAHASGLAVDVASFELANGETVPVKPNGSASPMCSPPHLATALSIRPLPRVRTRG